MLLQKSIKCALTAIWFVIWLLVIFFNWRLYWLLSPGDVPSRGPTEEPGPFHWFPTHQRAPLLSGPGPAAAQSHVSCHTQLLGRVPEHPPTDPESQPGTTSVLWAQSCHPESPLWWVCPGSCSSAATGAPHPSISPVPLVFPVPSSRTRHWWQGPADAGGVWLLSLSDGYHELQHLCYQCKLNCVNLS